MKTIGSWYALAVNTGSEKRVRERIFDRLEREKIPSNHISILCPEEEVIIHSPDGSRSAKKQLQLPGYLLIHGRRINDRTLSVIGRVKGVMEFLGPDGKPTPLRENEVDKILGHAPGEGGERVSKTSSAMFEAGDNVSVTGGPFLGFTGSIIETNESKGVAKLEVEIFGRVTPAEVQYRYLVKNR